MMHITSRVLSDYSKTKKNGKNVKALGRKVFCGNKIENETKKKNENANGRKCAHLKWFEQRKMNKTSCLLSLSLGVCMCGLCCDGKLDEFQVA